MTWFELTIWGVGISFLGAIFIASIALQRRFVVRHSSEAIAIIDTRPEGETHRSETRRIRLTNIGIIIIMFGFVLQFLGMLGDYIESQPLSTAFLKTTYTPCDLDCKQEFESKGYLCFEGLRGDFFCKWKNSAFTTDVVIAVGAAKVDAKQTFVPNSITVSIGINSTVRWTNVDDRVHSVVSDTGVFHSGLLKPNTTWIFPFSEPGTYEYHSVIHPWMKGVVNVLPLDENYRVGEPIQHYDGQPQVTRMLFRDGDSWGYLNEVKIIDETHVQLITSRPYWETRTLHIGERIIGNCQYVSDKSQISMLTIEKISITDTKFVEFREEVVLIPGDRCSSLSLVSLR